MGNYWDNSHTLSTLINIEEQIQRFKLDFSKTLECYEIIDSDFDEHLNDIEFELELKQNLINKTLEELKILKGSYESRKNYVERAVERFADELIVYIVEFYEECFDQIEHKTFFEEKAISHIKGNSKYEIEKLREELDNSLDKKTSVYFIKNESNGQIKIGISDCVDRRLSALQTACGDKLSVLGTIRHLGRREAKDLESRLHWKYNLNRKVPGARNTEWFDGIIEPSIEKSVLGYGYVYEKQDNNDSK